VTSSGGARRVSPRRPSGPARLRWRTRALHRGRVGIIDVVDPERRQQGKADVKEHRQEEHAGEHHEENALENLAVVDLTESDPDEGKNGSDTGLPESRGLRANATVWADLNLVPVLGGGAASLPLFTLPGTPILIALYAL